MRGTLRFRGRKDNTSGIGGRVRAWNKSQAKTGAVLFHVLGGNDVAGNPKTV
ncbi:MAG: hypothetical protein HZC54_18690 [Verrucomicrobia bacterium]|nr:hypothetical protein [Verrucomicrobiota bacterium]